MFEFAGYLFTVSEVIGTIIGLLGANLVLSLTLLLKGKKMSVEEGLKIAVDELDSAANSLVAAIESYRSAAAVGDMVGVAEATSRIQQIAAALRGEAAKLA